MMENAFKEKKSRNNNLIKNTAEILIVVLLAIIFASVINSAIFETTMVQQSSMYDTIYGGGNPDVPCDTLFDKFFFGNERREEFGDKVLVLKTKKVKYGDIITFYRNNGSSRYKLIKRVIAVGGDVVEIKNGYVYVNGIRLSEPYVSEQTYPTTSALTVSDNCIYVLGDNRIDSVDSRIFGEVSLDDVVGRVTLVIKKETKKLVWAKNL